MFESGGGGSERWLFAVGLVVLGVVAVFTIRPELLSRASLLAQGIDPTAPVLASRHEDSPYEVSPLAVSLELEARVREVDADGVLAWADELAKDVGLWLMVDTASADVADAEAALWARGGPRPLSVAFARELRRRSVYARSNRRLSAGAPTTGPVSMHPDELALLWAHVAWRLDLDAVLVRSPVHVYGLYRGPEGERVGVEPTCFRRVDDLGNAVPSQEPSVGRLLSFGEDLYPSGAGGIRHPDPMPAGVYEEVTDEALAGVLAGLLVARLDDPEAARALAPAALAGASGAWVIWSAELTAGLDAIEREDRAEVQRAHEALVAMRGSVALGLPTAPDERVLQAWLEDDVSLLRPVFAHHEPDGPVLRPANRAHEVAMWMDVAKRAPEGEDWNRRVIPLMNGMQDDDPAVDALCAYGRRALQGMKQTAGELMPRCAQ